LCGDGEVGLLSCSLPSDEAYDRTDGADRVSVGETPLPFSKALVSPVGSTLLAECEDCEGPEIWGGGGFWSAVEVTAEVSIVMVGARSRRSGVEVDCLESFSTEFLDSDMVGQEVDRDSQRAERAKEQRDV
jgi:hypothetical protein